MKLITLHQHWLIAEANDRLLKSDLNKSDYEYIASSFEGRFFNPKMTAALIFSMQRVAVTYALIYVVIEGYKQSNFNNVLIDNLLSRSDCVEALRRLRNATFHYQSVPFSPKAVDFILIGDSELWIKEIHQAFKKFFEQELELEKNISEFNKVSNEEYNIFTLLQSKLK